MSELDSALKHVYWIVRTRAENERQDGMTKKADLYDECWETIVKTVRDQAATLAEALEVIEPFAALSERNDKDAEDYGYSLLDDDRPQYFVWHPAEDGKPQRLNMGHLRHAADFKKKHGGRDAE